MKGRVGSVGRAPARQSGGRRVKSRSSQFFFVHPNLSEECTQSVSLVVYCMTFCTVKPRLDLTNTFFNISFRSIAFPF